MERNDSMPLNKKDPIFDEAVELVSKQKSCSPATLQNGLAIGYMRARRILEQMESDPGLRRIRLDSVADADGHRIGETGPDRPQRDLLRRQGSGGQVFH